MRRNHLPKFFSMVINHVKNIEFVEYFKTNFKWEKNMRWFQSLVAQSTFIERADWDYITKIRRNNDIEIGLKKIGRKENS